MLIDKPARRTWITCVTIVFAVLFAASGAFAQKEMPLTGSKGAVAKFIAARDKAENLEDPGKAFDEVVTMDPNFAYAYLFAGQSNPEAQRNLTKAIELAGKASPGEREWIYSVRDANNGDNAGQLSHLKALEKLFPGDKRVQMQLANYYRQQGDDATALGYLNNAVKIDKKYAAAYNLIGYTNINLHRDQDAETAFKTYIKLIPNNPNPYDSYAEFLLNSGKFDESIKQYNMALAKDPTFVNSLRGIGNDYAYKGDYDKAREHYQMMFDRSTSNVFNRDLALSAIENSYLQQGNVAKALEINDRRIAAAEGLGDHPLVRGLHNVAAVILWESGDLDGAAKHYAMADAVVETPPPGAGIVANRRFGMNLQHAQMFAMRGDFDAAKKELSSAWDFAAASHDPNNERAYYRAAGRLELAQKNYAKANEDFAKANPDDPAVWYYKALAAEGLGNKAAAMDLYRKVRDWNQLDTFNYSLVRALAVARLKQ